MREIRGGCNTNPIEGSDNGNTLAVEGNLGEGTVAIEC